MKAAWKYFLKAVDWKAIYWTCASCEIFICLAVLLTPGTTIKDFIAANIVGFFIPVAALISIFRECYNKTKNRKR